MAEAKKTKNSYLKQLNGDSSQTVPISIIYLMLKFFKKINSFFYEIKINLLPYPSYWVICLIHPIYINIRYSINIGIKEN